MGNVGSVYTFWSGEVQRLVLGGLLLTFYVGLVLLRHRQVGALRHGLWLFGLGSVALISLSRYHHGLAYASRSLYAFYTILLAALAAVELLLLLLQQRPTPRWRLALAGILGLYCANYYLRLTDYGRITHAQLERIKHEHLARYLYHEPQQLPPPGMVVAPHINAVTVGLLGEFSRGQTFLLDRERLEAQLIGPGDSIRLVQTVGAVQPLGAIETCAALDSNLKADQYVRLSGWCALAGARAATVEPRIWLRNTKGSLLFRPHRYYREDLSAQLADAGPLWVGFGGLLPMRYFSPGVNEVMVLTGSSEGWYVVDRKQLRFR